MPAPPDDQPTLSLDDGGHHGPQAFVAGDFLADRFRIVRFIGQGGMGEVYEAEDAELRECVALKTIRSHIAGREDMLARFKSEIQLARKVTHPNVCRIFDLARHEEITFLTMEMLDGESLAARLRRGPMTEAEALPVLRQMAAGLAAAHSAGVIHRDFKSSNVMLVPKPEELGGFRAVITDFGLAHTSKEDEGSETDLTGDGATVGTPAYMAPEQLEGGPVTAATDIYALGEVLFEMVTGKSAFTGPTPMAAAVKRLQHEPPSPRQHVPGLSRKWEETILRCLKRKPEERFSNANEVAAALEERSRVRKSAHWIPGVIIGLFLAVLAGVYLGRLRTPPPQEPPKARSAVAVIGFKNLSGRNEASWLSTALAEMVSTELAAGEKLRTVPGESVARMRLELALAEADSFGKETLARIRRSVAADYVVVGSYLVLGQTLRVDLRLQDARAGETIAAVSDSGIETDLPLLVTRTGARLREKLGAGGVSSSDAAAVRAAIPGGPEAQRLYAEGLAQLRVFNALRARDLLTRAAAADPQHPLIRSALSAAWAALGYDATAAEEGEKAISLAARLGREDRLWVEGLYRESAKQWSEAIKTYSALWDFYPDNLEYGLRLASAQTSGGKAKEALGTVARMRKLPPPASEDARIDIAEAAADDALADYKQMLAAAVRAREKSHALGARLLLARAHLLEGRASLRLGSPEKTVELTEAAHRIYFDLGDQVGAANSLNQLAGVTALRGDLKGADRIYRQILEVYRQAGNKAGMAHALNNLGINSKDLGDIAGARKMHEEALSIRREIGDRLNEAITLNNIAVLHFEESDLTGAKRLYRQALDISREVGDKRNMVRSMLNTAIVLEQQGDLTGSRRMHEESLAVRRQMGDRRSISLALHNLSTVLFALGDLQAARKSNVEALAIDRELNNKRGIGYELFLAAMIQKEEGNLEEARKLYSESLSVRDAMGEKITAAEGQLALSELAVEEGRPAEAVSSVQPLLPMLRQLKASQLEGKALLILASAHLAQGRLKEARQSLARFSTMDVGRQYRTLRFDAALAEARLLARSGKASEAARRIETVLPEAVKCGYGGYQLEFGLLLGEVEMSSSKAGGRARLLSIQREASAKGFGLIARKAEVSLQ